MIVLERGDEAAVDLELVELAASQMLKRPNAMVMRDSRAKCWGMDMIFASLLNLVRNSWFRYVLYPIFSVVALGLTYVEWKAAVIPAA
ncbi:MAG: hypothetical protein KL863_27795 [Rhizobium sp.]|nr:hypothetical protein [Rhizobium sp.]